MNDNEHGARLPDDGDETLAFEEDATVQADPDATLAAPESPAESVSASIGQYRVLGKLGEGGMGVVYEAEQRNPRRRVALKVVRGGQFVDDSRVRMFQREAETLGRLKHANIGAIYESGRTEDGQHFFAMELVRGKTLDVHLQRSAGKITPLELERRLELFRRITDAVHYAHQRGVIHRDLKPSNIIVTDAGESGEGSRAGLPEVKILDFGLARITEGDMAAATMMTEVGTIKGTLPYMSPEQARGLPEEIDLRTDVYALGVILYEMLGGQRPYDTQKTSPIEAVRVIQETPPKPLRQIWEGTRKLDEDLETIVGKALEKEADQRYASAAALSEDVERYLTSQPILARPPSTGYQIKKLVARNKLGASFAATLLVLLIGFGIWMNILWRRSELARARADASGLITLGRLEIEESPSSALAYALASLETSDSVAGRRFALEALWRGPPAHVVSTGPATVPSFSPDGRYLAFKSYDFETRRSTLVLRRSDGGEPVLLDDAPSFTTFDAASRRLFSWRPEHPLRVWSVPGGELLASWQVDEPAALLHAADSRSVISFSPTEDGGSLLRSWSMEGEESKALGHIRGQPYYNNIWTHADLDTSGSRIVHAVDGDIYVRPLASLDSATEPIGHHEGDLGEIDETGEAIFTFFQPNQETVGSALSSTGEIRFWRWAEQSLEPVRSLAYRPMWLMPPRFDPTGRYLAAGGPEGSAWFWDLEAPPDAEPIVLRRSGQQHIVGLAFHPEGRWLVTADNASAAIWPIDRHALELRGDGAPVNALEFGPRGRWLASNFNLSYEARLWPLDGNEPGAPLAALGGRSIAVHPDGSRLAIAHDAEDFGVALAPVDGGEQRWLGSKDNWSVAFSPNGRYVAATGGQNRPEVAVVTVWDIEAPPEAEPILLDAGDGKMVADVVFLGPERLVGSGAGGLRLWDLASRSFDILSETPSAYLAATADGETLLSLTGPGTWAAQGGVVWLHDLAGGESRELTSHGDRVVDVVVNPEGTMVVTGDVDGVVRVGPLSGEEPHLLLGHEGIVHAVAIDPKKRWIASGGVDGVIRLWPVPEGRPFHTLPREDLLARLRTSTNYRVVADEGTPDGYRLEVGPFPGWEFLPTW